jgi:hypothetical protein
MAASAGYGSAHNKAVRENKSVPIKLDRTDATRYVGHAGMIKPRAAVGAANHQIHAIRREEPTYSLLPIYKASRLRSRNQRRKQTAANWLRERQYRQYGVWELSWEPSRNGEGGITGQDRHPRTRIWLKLKITCPPEVGRPKLICGRNREKKRTWSSSRCATRSASPEMMR